MKKFISIQFRFLVFVVLAILFGALLWRVFSVGLEKYEKSECFKWQEQAQKHPSFYLVEWQKAQCDHYQIKVK